MDPCAGSTLSAPKNIWTLVYELEARNLLLVLGEYIWQQEVIAPRDQWKWAVEAVSELGDYAEGLGIEIAIELEPFHLSIVNTLAKMVSFLDDLHHPAVRANLDISHLALAHTPAEEIPNLQGRIAHVHFSDCDGKKHGDLPPGRGVVDFRPYLAELKKVGFQRRRQYRTRVFTRTREDCRVGHRSLPRNRQVDAGDRHSRVTPENGRLTKLGCSPGVRFSICSWSPPHAALRPSPSPP